MQHARIMHLQMIHATMMHLARSLVKEGMCRTQETIGKLCTHPNAQKLKEKQPPKHYNHTSIPIIWVCFFTRFLVIIRKLMLRTV